VEVIDYNAHPYAHYVCGFGEHDAEGWFSIIAIEERKRGNPVFQNWRKGDDYCEEQKQWLEYYWDAITTDSDKNYRTYKALKTAKASKERQQAAYARVWLREFRPWDKNARREVPSGLWRSGQDDKPNFTQGQITGEVVGGHKVKDTLRHKLGIVETGIAPMPKAELLVELVRRSGMDMEEVTNRFNREWKNKSRKLFHHHGGGVWSTVHYVHAKKLKAEALATLKDKAAEQRRKARDRTERQEQFWKLFRSLPQCVPNYDDPELCPFWQHVKSSPDRLAALEAIQSNAASKEKREMAPAKYVAYLRENLRNFIRDDLVSPYFKDGRYRQGREWYPVEVFANIPRVSFEDFRRRLVKEQYSAPDLQAIVQVAERNGDIVVDRSKQTVEGRNVRAAQLMAEEFKELEKQIDAGWYEHERTLSKIDFQKREFYNAIDRLRGMRTFADLDHAIDYCGDASAVFCAKDAGILKDDNGLLRVVVPSIQKVEVPLSGTIWGA
jgi:hypothetical protein